MDVPETAYVGLYGSHSSDWRSVCTKDLDDHHVPWYDPTDAEWESITDENGDSKQEVIDRLVEKQHRGMVRAKCVIFHLARRKSARYEGEKPNPDTRETVAAFAARCELGFLIGKGIRTFAHIEGDVQGRNYLWAAMKNYPRIIRCGSLRDATKLAIKYMSGADVFNSQSR